MSTRGMTMTLRCISSPPSTATGEDAAGPPTAPRLSRLRDWCCIGAAAIGLIASLNLGTCEPDRRPVNRFAPPASTSLSTLAPIMQTSPRKGGEGTPRQGLRCPAPKAARMAVRMASLPKAYGFAV